MVDDEVSPCRDGARVLAPSPEKELNSRKALLLPRPAPGAGPAPSTLLDAPENPGLVPLLGLDMSMLGTRPPSEAPLPVPPTPASITCPSKEEPEGSEVFGSRLAVQFEEDEDDEHDGLTPQGGRHPEKGKKLLLPQNSSGTSGTGSGGDGHSAKK